MFKSLFSSATPSASESFLILTSKQIILMLDANQPHTDYMKALQQHEHDDADAACKANWEGEETGLAAAARSAGKAGVDASDASSAVEEGTAGAKGVVVDSSYMPQTTAAAAASSSKASRGSASETPVSPVPPTPTQDVFVTPARQMSTAQQTKEELAMMSPAELRSAAIAITLHIIAHSQPNKPPTYLLIKRKVVERFGEGAFDAAKAEIKTRLQMYVCVCMGVVCVRACVHLRSETKAAAAHRASDLCVHVKIAAAYCCKLTLCCHHFLLTPPVNSRNSLC